MRAGSDIDHVMSLITAKGYRMPESMFYLRLVHLLDRSKRKELMIIYAKDIALNKFRERYRRKSARDLLTICWQPRERTSSLSRWS